MFITSSILDYNDYLYSQPRLVNSDDSDDDEIVPWDEDSNDENHWRNDYPDEESVSEDESIGERDMRRAMNNVDIGNELSSSDDEHRNDWVHSIDSEAINFEDDMDYCDVNRYGEAYARYRKRVVRELESASDDSDKEEDGDDQHQRSQGGLFHPEWLLKSQNITKTCVCVLKINKSFVKLKFFRFIFPDFHFFTKISVSVYCHFW